MEKIIEILQPALDHGITIGLEKYDGKLGFNLNTQAKSDCVLVDEGDAIVAYMRYGDTAIIEDFNDVLYTVNKCKHGRDYISLHWQELINKH